jgi:hypothetical protein
MEITGLPEGLVERMFGQVQGHSILNLNKKFIINFSNYQANQQKRILKKRLMTAIMPTISSG